MSAKFKLQRSLFTYTSCYCEENVYKLMECFKNFSVAKSRADLPESCPSRHLPENFQKDFSKFKVLFLSNSSCTFPIWYQRAGSYHSPDDPGFCMWDYHVIAFDSENREIYDLDSTLKIDEELSSSSSSSSVANFFSRKNKQFGDEEGASSDPEAPTFPLSLKTYWRHLLRSGVQFNPNYQQKIHVIDAEFFLKDFCSDRSHMKNGDSWMSEPPEYPCIVNRKGETMNLDQYRKFGKPTETSTAKGQVLTRDEFMRRF